MDKKPLPEKLVVDRELLLRVAKNARLNLSEKEIAVFLPQFKEMLATFQKISSIDADGFDPAFHPVEVKNVFREDVVEKSLSQEDALKNAKHKKDGFFKGPKVVG